jgi:hypothetical protein
MAATAEECKKLWFKFLTHVCDTHGRFGHDEEQVWPCTIDLNEEGGMNDEEFDKYIDNSIVLLYPDLEDTPEKRVLLKVDSNPGRNGMDLLNKARFQGVYLFLAFQTLPLCSRTWISIMIRSSPLSAPTSKKLPWPASWPRSQ